MKIVAISGWKGSGKDTAAAVLIESFGFKRVGFADPLKDNVAKQFGLDRASLDNQDLKEAPVGHLPVDPKDNFSRMIAQFMIKEFRFRDGSRPIGFSNGIELDDNRFVGCDEKGRKDVVYWTRRALCILEGSAKRSVDSDYWVSRAIQSARDSGTENVVISDLRYQSELSALKMAMGSDDHLVTVRINRFETSPSSDPSERDLDGATFDVIVENKTTIENFIFDVQSIGHEVIRS